LGACSSKHVPPVDVGGLGSSVHRRQTTKRSIKKSQAVLQNVFNFPVWGAEGVLQSLHVQRVYRPTPHSGHW
jgi:hypothetical protein